MPPWFYNRFESGSVTCVPTPDTCRACGGSGIVWEYGGEAEPQDKATIRISAPCSTVRSQDYKMNCIVGCNYAEFENAVNAQLEKMGWRAQAATRP